LPVVNAEVHPVQLKTKCCVVGVITEIEPTVLGEALSDFTGKICPALVPAVPVVTVGEALIAPPEKIIV
jgi:hypothetical protein